MQFSLLFYSISNKIFKKQNAFGNINANQIITYSQLRISCSESVGVLALSVYAVFSAFGATFFAINFSALNLFFFLFFFWFEPCKKSESKWIWHF